MQRLCPSGSENGKRCGALDVAKSAAVFHSIAYPGHFLTALAASWIRGLINRDGTLSRELNRTAQVSPSERRRTRIVEVPSSEPVCWALIVPLDCIIQPLA